MKSSPLFLVLILFLCFKASAQQTLQSEIIYDIDFSTDARNYIPLTGEGGIDQLVAKFIDKIIKKEVEARLIPVEVAQKINDGKLLKDEFIPDSFEILDPELLAFFMNDRLHLQKSEEYPYAIEINGVIYKQLKSKHSKEYIQAIESVFTEPGEIKPFEKIDENGFLIYDEQGNPLVEYDTLPYSRYEVHNFTLSFYEQWSYNIKANSFIKKVKGIIIHLRKQSPHGIYIELQNQDIQNQKYLMDKNVIATSHINNDKEGMFQHVDTSMRYALYRTLMESDSTHLPKDDVYLSRIEDKCLSQILLKGDYDEALDENGLLMYDEKGNVKLEYTGDIISLQSGNTISFLENWYFNWDTFSMKKVVKGLVSGKCFYPFNP